MSSSTSIAPVKAPSVLDASVDEYIARVLSKIPAGRRGVATVDASNAGVAASVGISVRPDLSIAGFAGKKRGEGWMYGGRGQFVF